jgi:hypothetical protein
MIQSASTHKKRRENFQVTRTATWSDFGSLENSIARKAPELMDFWLVKVGHRPNNSLMLRTCHLEDSVALVVMAHQYVNSADLNYLSLALSAD